MAVLDPSRIATWRQRLLDPAWQRGFADAIAYFTLAVSVFVTAILPGQQLSSMVWTFCLAVLTGAWMLWMTTLHPQWEHRPAIAVTYYVGVLALAAALVVRAPWFGIFTWTCYLHAPRFLPRRWMLLGLVGTAIVTATAQIGGVPEPTGGAVAIWLVVIMFNVLTAGTFTYGALLTDEQNENRGKMLAELTEANNKLATTMRENAGLHAQLLTQAREAGIADERRRMAREIHDTIAQGLIGIIAQLQAAEQARERGAGSQRHLDTAAALARESLSEARRAVAAERPEVLDNARLPDALTEVVHRWSDINGVATEISTTGTARPMHTEIEVTLLRTAQEALANVAKHARASRVGLTLSYMEDLVTLDVRDDGIGFCPAESLRDHAANGGFGLTAMRQRISRLSGTLEIESEPGMGTAISASVPAIPVGGGR